MERATWSRVIKDEVAWERYNEGGWDIIYSNFSYEDVDQEIAACATFEEAMVRMEKVAAVVKSIFERLIAEKRH